MAHHNAAAMECKNSIGRMQGVLQIKLQREHGGEQAKRAQALTRIAKGERNTERQAGTEAKIRDLAGREVQLVVEKKADGRSINLPDRAPKPSRMTRMAGARGQDRVRKGHTPLHACSAMTKKPPTYICLLQDTKPLSRNCYDFFKRSLSPEP